MFRFSIPRLFVTAALLSCIPVFGQNGTGSISGTVTDASGAVVPNAKIELIDEATNTKRDSVANGSGSFSFAAVLPSTWDVLVSAPGFTSWERKGIVVNQGSSLTIPNIILQVGSSTQQVEVVSSSEAVVPSDTGQVSQTLNEHMITELAIEGRDAAELIKIMPGMGNNQGLTNSMWNSLTTSSNSGPIGAFTSNGTQPNGGMTMTLDGANLLDPGNQGTQVANVNQNQTAEVTVLTSSYDASFAKGPATFQAIGKSGSAHFHGDAYIYARNGVFSSEDSYLKNQGTKKPDDSYYYPGGDIGGPVIIPGIHFNKNHDKLFFYSAYEYMNQNPSGNLLNQFVPTADMMGQNPNKPYLDFTPAYLDSLGSGWSGHQGSDLYLSNNRGCTKTQPNACIPAQYSAPFITNGVYNWTVPYANAKPNNPTYGQIPVSFLDPNSLALWKLMPTPNVDPTTHGGYNYQTLLSQPVDRWELRLRGDYNISDKHHVFFSYDRQDESDQNPVSVWWNMANALPYPSALPANQVSQVYSTNLTSMLTPTLTNEVVFAYASFINPIALANPAAVNPSKVGFNISNTFFSDPFPQLPNTIGWNAGQVPGYSAPTFGSAWHGGDFGKLSQAPNVSDNLTKVLGSHTVKVGFYWDGDRNQQTSGGWNSGPQGALNYMGGNAGTGVDFANFATGRVSQYTQSSGAPIDDLTYHTIAFYFNDSWKASRRLTVNLGMRFEHLGPWTPNGGAGLAVWDPATYNATCTTCSYPGVEWHAIDSSIPMAGFPARMLWPEPRAGFAYDIFGNGHTVLRGGFGIYRYQLAYNSPSGALNPGLNVATVSSTGDCCIGYNEFSSFAPTSSSGAGLGSSLDNSILQMGDDKTPYTETYNFTVSQQGPWKSVVELTYSGNRSRDLLEQSGLSNVDLAPVGAYYGPDPKTGVVTLPYVPNDGFNTADYVPYRQYTSIQLIGHGSYQNYNSLQATWQKQTGHYTFTTNYTFGKVMGIRDGETANGGGNGTLLDPFDISKNYGVLAYDHTHIFNAAYVINLPSPTKNKFLGGFVNGWELSGITQWQSGAPIQPNTAGTLNVAYGNVQIPGTNILTGASNSSWLGTNAITLVPKLTCDPRSGLASGQYFNPNCFSTPAFGTNGDFIWPYIKGPAFFNSDLSLYKNFAFRESQNIQLRFEAFNFINHPLPQLTAGGNSAVTLNLSGPNGTNANGTTSGFAPYTVGRRVIEFGFKYSF